MNLIFSLYYLKSNRCKLFIHCTLLRIKMNNFPIVAIRFEVKGKFIIILLRNSAIPSSMYINATHVNWKSVRGSQEKLSYSQLHLKIAYLTLRSEEHTERPFSMLSVAAMKLKCSKASEGFFLLMLSFFDLSKYALITTLVKVGTLKSHQAFTRYRIICRL